MNKSEELEIQSQNEDNDIKAFALLCKSLREKRSEKFEGGWLQLLEQKYNVVKRDNGSYTIATQEYGIIDYFPKANKTLIRSNNRWEKPGLRWIINNLFRDNE